MADLTLDIPTPTAIKRVRHDIDQGSVVFEDYRFAAPSYVYFIGAMAAHVKIGVSSRPLLRLAAIQSCNHCPLVILACFEGDRSLEQRLHKFFDDERIIGKEWFVRSPRLRNTIGTLQLNQARLTGQRVSTPNKWDDFS